MTLAEAVQLEMINFLKAENERLRAAVKHLRQAAKVAVSSIEEWEEDADSTPSSIECALGVLRRARERTQAALSPQPAPAHAPVEPTPAMLDAKRFVDEYGKERGTK